GGRGGGRLRRRPRRRSAVAGFQLGDLLAELAQLDLVHRRLALQLEDARLERLDLLLLGVARAQAGARAPGGQKAERDEKEGEAFHFPALISVGMSRMNGLCGYSARRRSKALRASSGLLLCS